MCDRGPERPSLEVSHSFPWGHPHQQDCIPTGSLHFPQGPCPFYLAAGGWGRPCHPARARLSPTQQWSRPGVSQLLQTHWPGNLACGVVPCQCGRSNSFHSHLHSSWETPDGGTPAPSQDSGCLWQGKEPLCAKAKVSSLWMIAMV